MKKKKSEPKIQPKVIPEPPRLLRARYSRDNYTDEPTLAMRDEPEAISEELNEQYAQESWELRELTLEAVESQDKTSFVRRRIQRAA